MLSHIVLKQIGNGISVRFNISYRKITECGLNGKGNNL